jgi:hypothetical protein
MTLDSTILIDNNVGAYAASRFYYATTQINSSYNRYFGNTTNRLNSDYGIVNSVSDSDNSDPKLVDFTTGDYHLLPGSPCADAGLPGRLDPDGSRNDQGIYGGPISTAFWPKSAGIPVVTTLSSSPHDVALGGTFTINGVGKAQ